MSFSLRDFGLASKKGMATAALALAVGVGFPANDALAVDMTCQAPQTVMAQMSAEGQIPVGSLYLDGSPRGATKPEYKKVLITVNPETREGYRVGLNGVGGTFCPNGKLSNVVIYDYTAKAIASSAFMNTPTADGPDGINRYIYGFAKNGGQFPVLKANEYVPALRDNHILYITANPDTGKGGFAAARPDGTYNSEYSKIIYQTNPDKPSANDTSFLTAVGQKIAVNPAREIASNSPSAGAGMVALGPRP